MKCITRIPSKVIVEPVEEMKNKSSRRTLPLPDPVYEMLCEEREKQDLYRRMFKGSYNRKFDDYICVDQLGELLRPNRVTQRFADLIERYNLRKIRFHDLRHTFASILINQDAMNSLQINIDRMNEINESPSQSGETAFSPKDYDITFDHVGFAYNSGETVLKDVSFTAKQGEVTALIGPSGGGKSTAAKLAARFWDIDRGRITVGGVDVGKVDPERLLTAYSIVFQDVTLFNNTVMENIRIGRKDATDAEAMQAAKEAMCDEFISKLPQGYQTMIGENGSTLSGGERQRISIARALLKDAPIILLDEATASLDAENETEIQQAISRLVEKKTVLIIAHRMRTVENANKIVVLSGGTVVETGTPEELMKKNGAFARMVKLQTESQNWSLG